MLKHKGFTLVELLSCLIILGMIAVFSLPISKSVLQKNELEYVEDEVRAIVHLAKTQSLLRHQDLILAPLNASNGNWGQGMMLFTDDGSHRYSHESQLVQQWTWKHPSVEVFWKGFQNRKHIIFSSWLRKSTTNGHFTIKNGETTHKLVLNRIGRCI